MARYIDADKADVERISCFYGAECRIEDVKEWLDEQPTADVQEVKHGEWIYHPETFYTKSGFTCSVCKDPMWHSHDVKQAFKYCPHCGARMDGDNNA